MNVYRVMVLALTGLLCALLMTIAACSSLTPVKTPPPTLSSPLVSTPAEALPQLEVPSEAPVPEPGKASISGVLYSFTAARTIPDTTFYLTPAHGEATPEPPTFFVGPRPEEGDIRGRSGAQGQILLSNVPPGSYYVAVWAPYNWILVPESDTDPTPRLVTLAVGERRALGVLSLSWP